MYYLGVDVGGTNIAVGIVDENNAIIAKASRKTPVPCSEEVFCDTIVDICKDALGQANLTFDDVPWIGIGCPGTVNRATGIIEFAKNLYFKNFKLREM
ncbi:MAG: ROK family protein, partial [Ruminococcus bromii]|nr:ROK family protein [Ruminococcus bromii]